jgi:tRNA (guanine10-N2)-dimethyltransferase
VSQTPFLFELSGEHPTLPPAEASSCCLAEAGSFSLLEHGPGYVILAFPDEFVEPIGQRIALTHRIGRHLASCEPSQAARVAAGLELPEGTFAVRIRRQGQCHPEVDCNRLAAAVGAALARGRRVDLVRPDTEVRLLLSDRLHIHLCRHTVDRSGFEERKVAERPFFSPISLHPRYARALVNLTRVRRGERLLDPFCGTGGILIEAASIGVRAVGSDLSPEMVEGCKDNLRHFGLEWDEVEVADVGSIDEVFEDISAVATDPPYGRSASTMREPVAELYSRALPALSRVVGPGRGVGVVLPRPCPSSHDGLELREAHEQRVHRSLTRHYCLFTRR